MSQQPNPFTAQRVTALLDQGTASTVRALVAGGAKVALVFTVAQVDDAVVGSGTMDPVRANLLVAHLLEQMAQASRGTEPHG